MCDIFFLLELACASSRKNALALLYWTQDLFGRDSKERKQTTPPASFVAQQLKSNLNHDSSSWQQNNLKNKRFQRETLLSLLLSFFFRACGREGEVGENAEL